MNRTRAALAGGAAIAGLTIAACGSAHAPITAPSAGHTAAAPVAATTPAAPTANPAGTATGSCDYTLSDSLDGIDWLTAEVDLTSTGNVGAVVRVVVKWPQEGFAPIKAVKTVRMPYGASDLPVRFHVSAGSIQDGSNVIGNLQSWISGHNYPSNYCSYKEAMISTFGTVH